ncbi:hypothetical protein MNBD_ALPHA08-1774 [hydrothermal vent metagenome]|uniref:TadE-like domain-containing protein n=1 Tax=hydrothermal vent metagenome TaxID=652676 RepID=A0A3B0SGB9_9ZZZZ
MMISVNKRLNNMMGRYRRSQEGVTAIEFALVGGPFFFVLFALFELGIMLFAEYALAQNIENAGRLIRTGQIQTAQNGHENTPAYFKTQICKNLTTLLDCDNKLYVDVRKFNNFAGIAGSLPSPFTAGTNELSPAITSGTQFEAGAAGEIVSIRVYYDWQLFLPGLGQLIGAAGSLGNISVNGSTAKNSKLLTAAATFRNEPFN